MPSRRRFDTLLPFIATLVASHAVGCRTHRGTTDGGTPPTPSPATPATPATVETCRGFGDALLEGITLAPALGRADYLELREETAGLEVYSTPKVLGKSGRACAQATDKPRCEIALRDVRSTIGFIHRVDGNRMVPQSYWTYLVANFGDSFRVIASDGELRQALAPVETTNDVELLAGCGKMVRTPTGWNITKTYVDRGDCYGGASGWKTLAISADGVSSEKENHVVQRPPTCISGRRPQGLKESGQCDARGSLTEYFKESAYLEAASVVAFERLALELEALGAPADLIERASQSREDEVAHASALEALVRSAGGTPRPLAVDVMPPRSAFAMALENAVEGCIRETFGALVAHYQAQAAESEAVRTLMRGIADDETLHASLAWDVAAWLEPRFSADERQQLHTARAHALQELRASLEREPSLAVRATAGLPAAREAKQLLSALASGLGVAYVRSERCETDEVLHDLAPLDLG